MAYASSSYTGDGTTTDFAVTFSFLQRDHVKVSVAGTEDTTFTWASANTITPTVTPTSGQAVLIWRDSSVNSDLQDFATGYVAGSDEIDASALQAFFLAEEAKTPNPVTVTGIHASNTALVSLLAALETLGLIVDETTAS